MNKVRILINKFFRDSSGKIVIAQKPNLVLYLAITLWILYKLLANDRLGSLLQVGYITALAYWAILELTLGVNYFRKTLGLIVLLNLLI